MLGGWAETSLEKNSLLHLPIPAKNAAYVSTDGRGAINPILKTESVTDRLGESLDCGRDVLASPV